MIAVSAEVQAALEAGRPVVALETTLVAHGFPGGEGLKVALEAERRVRAVGAVPATVGVVEGSVRIGLAPAELELFSDAGQAARKCGPRDLGACTALGLLGATTVGGTLAAAGAVGIRFLGTGGIGGVHRGFAEHLDVSADLGEIARRPLLVVSSGIKSLLDVPATLELLEALGVPVVGWQTETVPLFYTAAGGPPAPWTARSAAEAAAIAQAHWALGRSGLLLARPPSEGLDVEPLIEAALAEAAAEGISGQAVTPFVLAHVHRATGGESVRVNRQLIVENAALAAEVAVAFAEL